MNSSYSLIAYQNRPSTDLLHFFHYVMPVKQLPNVLS